MHTFIFALVLALASSLASANEVSIQFTGSLTQIDDQYGLLSGQFATGNLFEGNLTYNTSVPEGITTILEPTFGIYSAITHFRTSINGFVFEESPQSLLGTLQVWDDRIVNPSVVDAVTFTSGLDYTPPITGMGLGTVVGNTNLYLFDFTHVASQNGKTLPASVNFDDYGTKRFSIIQLNTDTNQSFVLNGVINTIKAVPEPSPILLLFMGLLLACKIQLKNQRGQNKNPAFTIKDSNAYEAS